MPERRYTDPLPLGSDEQPYSKGLMARALIRAGVSVERAVELARKVELDLSERGKHIVDLERLRELAIAVLGEAEGDRAINHLRRYNELNELDVPLILLIGGATGTGKSTVATEVAYRLGITRVTSTDFVRHTMRAFFSREFMPSIHFSSFEAGEAVAHPGEPPDVVAGFLEQTRDVLV